MEADKEDTQETVERALAADREASLNDVFACSAMAALLVKSAPLYDAEAIAREAYYVASVMLDVRRKRGGAK